MHIFAYRPTDAVRDTLEQHGTLEADWGDEVVYDVGDRAPENDDFSDRLYETNNTTNTILAAEPIDGTIERQLFFDDKYPDNVLAPILNRMTPGGDIRKYMNDLYSLSGDRSAVECWLGGTCKPPRLAAFEPFPMWAVQELLQLGVCEGGMAENPYYPSADRILQWADIVRDKWGCRTGALGTLHVDDCEAGLDGFVIYDADEDIREWAAERWSANPSHPYMRPDEFDLRDFSDTALETEKALRVWFD